MTDWRQIQARIRKAKTSSDPLTKLSELYQRTRDAMVAWELGTVEEKAGRAEQAAKWYSAAAQRFRRAEWKKKAEEALVRLGFEVPAASDAAPDAERNVPPEPSAEFDAQDYGRTRTPLALGEIDETETSEPAPREDRPEPPSSAADELAPRSAGISRGPVANAGRGTADASEGHKKRRRGRRGGRGRHRKPAAGSSPSLPAQTFTPAPPSSEGPASRRFETSSRTPASEPADYGVSPEMEDQFEGTREERRRSERTEMPLGSRTDYAESQLPSERTTRGRAGDPALASRMARLESMLRRLLSGPAHHLDELDDAPAGPGVFLLSDSDQITSYYVEACQTLRIGVGNLVRGSRAGKGRRPTGRGYSEGGDLKEKLADHLGINQSKVSQYMKEHCVIRWIQLDEDAPHLAHFAVAVLRSPLNVE
ncbi:MAG TPA: hypothetical protein VKS44_01055 [Candidatus Acidoferrales bacterium]|nr:hypothetical protein [Candidatus Acidoferrales bacterium]